MHKKVTKTFRAADKGLGKVLGSLEEAIMEALWKHGTITGKEVIESVGSRRRAATTTVLTVLDRLVKKGLVKKFRGEDVFLYAAAYSKEEFGKEASKEVLSGVIDLWSGSAVASFVDILASRDREELDRLESLILKKKNELGKGA